LAALRYFRAFFLPNQLSADTDHTAVASIFENYAWLGFLFLGAIVGAAILASRKQEWRPTAFGLWWFLIALVPTAAFPLAEVENDHRMFFPFVGLALAVTWGAALWIYRADSLPHSRASVLAAFASVVLIALGTGTVLRNTVWRNEETLWADVVAKSPRNGRGLMNYGLTQMSKGDYRTALDYFERASIFNPAYATLEINLAIANGGLQRDEAAIAHFTRALRLTPTDSIPHYFYGRWLDQKGRLGEAATELARALELNPDAMDARALLLDVFAHMGNWDAVRILGRATLDRFPSDPTATRYLALAQSGAKSALESKTAEDYLNLSLQYHRAGQFQQAIAAAQKALALRPGYAEAFNNIAAGFASLGQWDEAIAAARQAVALKPDFQLARNNLAWSVEQKHKTQLGALSPSEE
jgi:tetratricopeptide (TPR) repeat protein